MTTKPVTGTVHFFPFEGGFWAVRGDDRVTYHPFGGLPAEFQQEGLRVYMVARERRDMASFHMAGPIVEIVSIQREVSAIVLPQEAPWPPKDG